ncbi:C39 family peptidase [Streptomyces sp. ISL-44]|uniref:C39 family peptidase n=1 Tax=Streptomyces sp. ISL-44 TaxID=2819184 RepID=UPI001BE9B310|nr:C39 family peptidase [Streptomyces sp. ISL-44]MBT2539782.1 C39 family peptidase [Streptomyces sp. ISL-44]
MSELAFPTVTQYASPDLIEAIAYQGHAPADDPRWKESGAPDHATYTRWCTQICGIACLRMILLRRDGHAPTLFDLLDGARKYGAYTENTDTRTIRGLIYAPFADYVHAELGLVADVHGSLPAGKLIDLLDAGQTVMGSVHKEIRRPDQPAPGRGGHLVLVTGHKNGAVRFRNPSGHTTETRNAELPIDVFTTFYGQRGIAFD